MQAGGGDTVTRSTRHNKPRARTVKNHHTFPARIRAAWGRQVPSIFETGQLLIEAKAKLPHGAWGAMFKGADRLPFSQETARCLMAIARHPVLNSKATWNLLPPSWWTIYILSRAPVANLRSWLADATVNCETTANKAQALYPAWQSPRTKPSPIIRDPDDVIPRLKIPVEDLALAGPSTERSQTLETLEKIGFNMGDVEDELADIAAGAEGTQTPAPKPVEKRAWLLRIKIDECLDYLERDCDKLKRTSEFEQWVLRAASRLRRLLDTAKR
jgi:DUF3102 family protein